MEFQRIGKNTIQCHMTMEEMSEYGLGIEDLFTNQDKSRDFLEQLVERAEEEVGYEVEGGMVSMQLMRMPDDSLVITFSDKGDEGIQGMLNQIQNLVGMMDEGTADSLIEAMAMEEAGASEEGISVSDFIQDLQEKVDYQKRAAGKPAQRKARKRPNTARLFCFPSLSAVEDFAVTVQLEKNIPSRLYKDEARGKWYLFLKKGKLRQEEYQTLCQRVTEYAGNATNQPFAEQFCKEHFRLIIGKQALKTLREYAC